MNPIARMMKRYIKTPLKYALPLLFIGALVLVSISGCLSSTNNSPSPVASSEPTGVPTVAPTEQPVATAVSTPVPTVTAISPTKLTDSQLATFESSMTDKGYTVTEHLHYATTLADGSLRYDGKLTSPDGYSTTYQIYVYKDSSSADAGFASAISVLKGMGFNEHSSDSTSWTGLMGASLAGGAVESSGSELYMVAVFFMSA